jgi:O-antigen ligase/tetratricopeptide (TPR) repeat protein
MSGSSFTKLDFYTLTFALGLSALAAGAVHLPILAGYAALLVLSALVCAIARRDETPQPGSSVTAIVLIWLGLALLCSLQAVPLPLGVLERIAPANADVWSRSLRPFGEAAPAFASLSLAPGRSLVEAVKAASYALVFLISSDLARRHGLTRLLGVVFGIGVLLAAVTALHDLFDARALYGFYRPLTSFEIAPLFNANSRAGLLSLTFFAGLGVFLRLKSQPLRVFSGFGLGLVLAVLLMCRSRGGTLGLAIGLVLLLVLSLLVPRRSGERARALVSGAVISAIALCATALAVVALRHESWQGLFSASTSKLELFRGALCLIRDHAWLGVGRGAFASVFPAYQLQSGNNVYEHAENFVLQWAAEWGVPLTLLALTLLARALRPLFVKEVLQSPTRRAALVGVIVLLLQNQVDLGLELPAVSALLACVLGALLGARQSGRARRELPPMDGPRARRLLPIAAAVLALCLGLVAIAPGVESPASARQALHEQLQHSPRPTPPALWRALQRATLAFPAEPYFALLGGAAALADGKDALPWAARALERAPLNGAAYVLLARALWARGVRGQAVAALRHALEVDAGQTANVLALMRAWRLEGDDLAALVPAGSAGVPLLQHLTSTAPAAERQRWLDAWLARSPDDPLARHAAALALVGELERGAASERCGARRDACSVELEHRLAGLDPSVPNELLRARLAALRGDRAAAEATLRRACASAPGDINCNLALIDIALANRSPDLEATVHAVVASACTSRESCAGIHRALADRFAGNGEWNAALEHYQQALREAPTAELYKAAAGAAERLGRPVQAAALRRRAEGL